MKEKILEIATDLFLNYGFKSVTMDDIAHEMGISKKTIYQHYANKTKLVEATTMHAFEMISDGIDGICDLQKNPIDEVFQIESFVSNNLKDEKASPQYQLQKYYPKIYKSLKGKKFNIMIECVKENLSRGMKLGFYRKNLNIDIISKLYFNTMVGLRDEDLFPLHDYSLNTLIDSFLEYHLRGICTTKGLDRLNSIIDKKQFK